MSPATRFLLAIGIICLGSYAAIILFARTATYCALSQNYADSAPCYQPTVAGRRAEILFVGDSALLYAVRPSAVRAATGYAAYNLGMQGPAFSFDPAALIDRYLARNARPRLIILYASPWDRIEPHRLNDPQWYPLAVLALRHGGLAELARLVTAHPLALAEIPPLVVRSIGLDRSGAARRRAAMAEDDGHLDYATALDRPLPRLPADCAQSLAIETPIVGHRMRSAVTTLRRRYTAMGIPTMFYVAPSAACDGASGATRRAYAGLADNLPQALPDALFVDDTPRPTHVHVNAEGSAVASALAARFVAAHMRPGTAP